MNHEPRVREADGLEYLAEQCDSRREVEAVPVAVLGDRYAVDQFHREERHALGGDARIVEPRDMLVLERGQEVALARETLGCGALGLEARVRDLEGDLAEYRGGLLGEPHGRHAAGAERADQAVRADHGAGF